MFMALPQGTTSGGVSSAEATGTILIRSKGHGRLTAEIDVVVAARDPNEPLETPREIRIRETRTFSRIAFEDLTPWPRALSPIAGQGSLSVARLSARRSPPPARASRAAWPSAQRANADRRECAADRKARAVRVAVGDGADERRADDDAQVHAPDSVPSARPRSVSGARSTTSAARSDRAARCRWPARRRQGQRQRRRRQRDDQVGDGDHRHREDAHAQMSETVRHAAQQRPPRDQHADRRRTQARAGRLPVTQRIERQERIPTVPIVESTSANDRPAPSG